MVVFEVTTVDFRVKIGNGNLSNIPLKMFTLELSIKRIYFGIWCTHAHRFCEADKISLNFIDTQRALLEINETQTDTFISMLFDKIRNQIQSDSNPIGVWLFEIYIKSTLSFVSSLITSSLGIDWMWQWQANSHRQSIFQHLRRQLN